MATRVLLAHETHTAAQLAAAHASHRLKAHSAHSPRHATSALGRRSPSFLWSSGHRLALARSPLVAPASLAVGNGLAASCRWASTTASTDATEAFAVRSVDSGLANGILETTRILDFDTSGEGMELKSGPFGSGSSLSAAMGPGGGVGGMGGSSNGGSNNGNGNGNGNRKRPGIGGAPNRFARRPLSIFSGIRIDSQPMPEIPSTIPILPTGDNRVLLPGLLMRLQFRDPALSPVLERLWEEWSDNSDLIVGCVPIVKNSAEFAAQQIKGRKNGSTQGTHKHDQDLKTKNSSTTTDNHENNKLTDAQDRKTLDTTALSKTVSTVSDAAKKRQGAAPSNESTASTTNQKSVNSDKQISWKAIDQGQLNQWGCAARIIQFSRDETNSSPFSHKTYAITLEGLTRFQVTDYTEASPTFTANIVPFTDSHVPTDDKQLQASIMNLRHTGHNLANSLLQLHSDSGIIEPLRSILDHTEPHRLPDLLTCMLDLSLHEKLGLLSMTDIQKRINLVLEYIVRQSEIFSISQKLHSAVEADMAKKQREYVLRQKKMAIMKELGEAEENEEDELSVFSKKLKDADLPEYVMSAAQKELKKLKKMPTSSAEYGVIRNYLDLIVELPWNKETQSDINLVRAKKQLDDDHYGLEKVKKRFLEYLAVLKLNQHLRGPILCLVGPPGVGKTSLGRSIATAMGREFYRISLGGVRDEAQIRGHRRTYVGAMAGLLIQALRRVNVKNPVILLDEIDKLGSDFRGDPASALLEVLDPEQNSTFNDHYLNLPFDLSKVVFIATANSLEPIPEPLLDRMETISLSGYTVEEKVSIAKSHLVPKQIERHGMTPETLSISDDVLTRVATAYTRESGVRVMEREIASVCRAKAVEYVEKKEEQGLPITPLVEHKEEVKKEIETSSSDSSSAKDVVKADSAVNVEVLQPKDYDPVVNLESLEEILGPEKYEDEISERVITPGVAVGLAWRASGSGGLLFVEATKMPGKGGLVLTGKLGDVIKESAQIGLSWVRAHWGYFNIPTGKNSFMDGFESSPLAIESSNEDITTKKKSKTDVERAQEFFSKYDVHIHFPAGAIPKDGPSAGVTLITSLVSLFTGVPVTSHLAMTGEVSLRGLVLPVGGIKEKVIAAHRGGVKTIVIPAKNKKDLVDVPQNVKDDMQIFFAERITDVLRVAFVGGEQSQIWKRNDNGILIASSHHKWQSERKEKLQKGLIHSHHTHTHHENGQPLHHGHTSAAATGSPSNRTTKILTIANSKALGLEPKL